MKSIIIGAGEVGMNIARHLVEEDQSVVLIDSDPEKLQHVNDVLDVQTVVGMGSHPDVLEQAGAEHADMLIAVTQSDEVNMVACQMAYSLFDVPKKIARVRNASYLELTQSHLFTQDNMPVDVIISPELEVAHALMRTVAVPGAFEATDFAYGKISLVGVRVDENSIVANVSLDNVMQNSEVAFSVLAIFRGERVIVPQGSDHVEAGDEVFFMCQQEHVEDVMGILGFEAQKEPQRAFIIGGGNIGMEIARRFQKRGMSVRILENNIDRAEYMADTLRDVTVLHGDAFDRNLLSQENIGEMGVVLAVTSDDAANILSSVLARQLGAKNVITRINQTNFIPLTENLGLERIVSPRDVTASRILQHVRRGHIYALHTLHNGRAEVMEMQVGREANLVGMRIRDIRFPEGVVIGAIYSPSRGVVIPDGQTVINAKDRVIMFSVSEQVHDVEALF